MVVFTRFPVQLKDHYMHDVMEQAYPFRQDTKDRLDNSISRLVTLYAKCVTRDDVAAAVRQLKLYQREQIAWERDTVWRTMISQERRGVNDGQVKALGGHVATEGGPSLDVRTPIGRFKLTAKHGFFLTAVVVFAILLNVRILRSVEANNCFAVLLLATILWATEACSQCSQEKCGYHHSHPFIGNTFVCDFPAHTLPSCGPASLRVRQRPLASVSP